MPLGTATPRPPFSLADLHALGRLGFDSVAGITTLVEEMHRNIARVSPPLGLAPEGRAPGLSGLVRHHAGGHAGRACNDGSRIGGRDGRRQRGPCDTPPQPA